MPKCPLPLRGQHDYGLLALAIEIIFSCFVFASSTVGNPSKHNDCKSTDRSHTAVMNSGVCGHNKRISRYLWSTSYRKNWGARQQQRQFNNSECIEIEFARQNNHLCGVNEGFRGMLHNCKTSKTPRYWHIMAKSMQPCTSENLSNFGWY